MVSYWKSYLQKVVVLVSFLFLTAICSGAEAEFRSLYVYSWGSGTFLNWTEVSTLVNIARTYNFNAIVPEIRKVGDAYYTSLYEPRANNPAVNDPDSTFDALSAMIQYAHDTSNGKAYIEVHAWMVANRIWKGSLSGAPSGHILLQHPEWAMLDYSGASSNSEGMYLDPGIPGAQDHQHKVWMDVVRRYDVDGIVLDYIRYPGYTWGYATTSLNRFNKLYSRTGKPSSTDGDFSQFRRDNISSMVKKLYAEVMEEKPSVKVSICAIPWGYTTTDFYDSSAYNDVFQDWKGMMEGHFLDYLSPMIYDPESPDYRAIRYRNWNLASKEWSGGRHVYVLQGSYMNTTTQTRNQLYYSRETADMEGLQIYRYGYATNAGGSEDIELYAYLTTEMFQSKVTTPAMPWKTQSPYGIIKGTILYGTSSVDGAVVNLYSGDTLVAVTTTDATGFYAFMDVTPGNNINVKADGTRWGYAYRYSSNYSLSSCQVVNVDVNLLNVEADFYGVTTTGISPLTVKFVDTSANYPNRWHWSFGDGTYSTEQNPVHVYTASNLVQSFDVQLIAANEYGADTIFKPGYIRIYKTEKTALPDLKLFLGQSYPDAFNLEDFYSDVTITSSSLLFNFLGKASLSGNMVSEGAYNQATCGTNYYQIAGTWGEDTSTNRVKYSTYKLAKLSIIGIKKDMAVDFPVSEYAYDSAGKTIPESFGHPDSLVISDTTAIQAQWAGDSIIQIQAGLEFTTEGYVDIIASLSESSPFGMDMDKERLRVCPDLLTTGSFASDSELAQYGYETTAEFSNLASYSWVSSVVDKNNLAAQGCLAIQFSESTSGIKVTPTSSNWVDYQAGQWYIARARIFSPDPNNKIQFLLYNFSNETREGTHVDLSAHIYFGVPAAWTWVDIPLYSNQTGKGFPQLILKSFNASTIYLDELQIINAIPDVVTTLRKPGALRYPYGKFNTADDFSGWGWEGYRTDRAITTLPSLTVANGWLEADFAGAGDGTELKGFKATATYGRESSIYTPVSQQGYGMAMKSLVNIDTTAFNSSEAVYIMIMMGVTQEGDFEILKEGTDIIASGEFGGITNGWHYLAADARSPYYQFQFSLKNNQGGKAQIGYVDLAKDTDGMDFGDDTLFP